MRPDLAPRPRRRGLATLARGALHRATYPLPVSNDDAILLLMARQVLHGELATTLWNQPYNGALDAYLLAPFVALVSYHAAYRLYQLRWQRCWCCSSGRWRAGWAGRPPVGRAPCSPPGARPTWRS